MKKPVILVVHRKPEKLLQQIDYSLDNGASLHSAADGMEAMLKCQQLKPAIVIVDIDLPDFNGMTVASAIKDNKENQALVYLTGLEGLLENAKADRYLPYGIPYELFIAQLKHDFQQIQGGEKLDEGMENAIVQQYDCLVPACSREDTGGAFSVNRLLSPYYHLSGDGLHYTLLKSDADVHSDNKDGLYGFIFDCVGHDLLSYGQAMNTLYILKTYMWQYQAGVYETLDEVIKAVNREVLNNFVSATLIPTLCFFMDIHAPKLIYCSAGIPSLLVKYKDHSRRESISCRSYMIGYDRDVSWHEECLDLSSVEEITFITDGLNDLLREKSESADEPMAFAKHDDISAIFIKIFHDNK